MHPSENVDGVELFVVTLEKQCFQLCEEFQGLSKTVFGGDFYR